MKKFLLSSAILTFTSPLLLLSAGTALAQQQQAQISGTASGALEEVIVTAQYREEKLQETPIAITAITAQDIQERGFTDSYEIGYTVPNASFRPAQAAYGNTMTAYIRGVGQYDFDQAFEPGVGIYVDDVYQPFTLGTQMDLLDMDRVEVLRGPQGTLFGRGSIGGVVRMITKQPQGDNTGYIDVTAGSFNRIDVRAGYDFRLSDNVFARVAGVSRNSEGYQKVFDFACVFQDNPALVGTLKVKDPSRGRNCQTATQGGTSIAGGRVQLRIVPNDLVDITFAVDYEDDNSEAKADTLVNILYPQDLNGNTIPTSSYVLWNQQYAQHVPTPAEPWGYGVSYDARFIPDSIYDSYATYEDQASGLQFKPESGIEKISYSGKLVWKFGDSVALTAVGAYNDMTGQLTSDADGSPLNLQVTGGQQDFRWSTGELRLNGRAFDRVDWTLGGFYYESTATNRQAVSFPPLLWGATNPPALNVFLTENLLNVFVNTNNVADSKAYAGYAHTVTTLTDKLFMTLGVRYSKDKKDVSFQNSTFIFPDPININIDDDHFDWRVGFDYRFTDSTMGYVSAATGYRPPAYNPRPFSASQAVAVGGEEATAYELGFKADLLERTLRTNFAIFYTDYNKRIVPIGGTECVAGTEVPPNAPGAIQDSAGNTCLTVISLVSYQQLKDGKVKGAELEVDWRPVSAMSVSGTFGYTHWSSPEIDNCDFNQDGQPDAGITCADRPPFVPEFNWSLSLAYDFGIGNSSAKITPRVDVYGQSDICSSATSALSCQQGYELVNARLEWTSSENEWTAAVGGTNLTNEEYYYNLFDLTLFGQNTVEGQPAPPREWYVRFSRRF